MVDKEKYQRLLTSVWKEHNERPNNISKIIFENCGFADDDCYRNPGECVNEKAGILFNTYSGALANNEPTPAQQEFIMFLVKHTVNGKKFLSERSTSGGSSELPSSEDIANVLKEAKGCKEPVAPNKLKITFQDIAGQEETKDIIRNSFIYPSRYPNLFVTQTKGLLFYGPAGTGKCLAPNEKVLMFDGTIKEAQYIQQGELLMGDDSTPRTVMSTCVGEDEMFKIIPTNGESYTVNSPHIISLVSSQKPFVKKFKDNQYIVNWLENGEMCSKSFNEEYKKSAENYLNNVPQVDYIDIPLNEYIQKSKSWKKLYKGYRVGVDWPEQKVPLDPYIFGSWLLNECKEENKHIPQIYKTNSRNIRLDLLAGLIDNGGCFNTTDNSFVINSKRKVLSDDIAFLVRSLGYCIVIQEVQKVCENSNVETHYNCCISGKNLEQIPTKLLRNQPRERISRDSNEDELKYEFEVETLGKGKYCGFELDGNHRFLLKDFTVTHNTLLAKATVAELRGLTAFYDPTPGEIKGSKHGRTEKNINLIFDCACKIIGQPSPYVDENGNQLKYESSIIFIDEFEGLGGLKKGDPMMTLSVNTLLQKMDGMSSCPGVSVIAATNFPWNLEDAILRRFTNRVLIDLPDQTAREFLLLEPLYKYFYFPPMDEEEKKKKPLLLGNGTLDYSFLDKLKEYGETNCYKFGGGNVNYPIISKDFIKKCAEELGPNENGADLIEQIKNGSKSSGFDPAKENLDDIKVGHSGSDISKIMDIAIQKAASRALENGTFIKVEPWSNEKSERRNEYFYISLKEPPASDSTRQKPTHTIFKKEQLESGLVLIPNTAEERKRIINLSICEEDIEYAMHEYPSTIQIVNYLDLLIYRYQNRPPPPRR
jgi:SpoVK/Ycf46/Vps4 family AAA+-type ATPase